ncbi:MAG TPA: hypothetical protein PLI01_14665, partial [Nitrospira sp.]|nr:hypothetical protein [Nitrospira sp.]
RPLHGLRRAGEIPGAVDVVPQCDLLEISSLEGDGLGCQCQVDPRMEGMGSLASMRWILE